MIEHCLVCNKTHEVHGEDSFGGIRIFTCPEIPENMWLDRKLLTREYWELKAEDVATSPFFIPKWL